MGKGGIHIFIGSSLMAVAVILAIAGFIGGGIGVMFIGGLITLIVGFVKRKRSAPG